MGRATAGETIYVRGDLPLPPQMRGVMIGAVRTGPEIDLRFQIEPGAQSTRAVIGSAAYRVMLRGIPPGKYTLRVERMILDRAGRRRDFLPDQIVRNVRVPAP